MTVFRPDTPGSAPSRTQCPRRRSSAARPSSQGRRQILQEGIHQVPLSSRMTIGGPSPLKMLSTGSSKSGGVASRNASKVWTTTPTTTIPAPIAHPRTTTCTKGAIGLSLLLVNGAIIALIIATRLGSNQRASDVQPHVLRDSSLMGEVASACGGTRFGLVELAGVSM